MLENSPAALQTPPPSVSCTALRISGSILCKNNLSSWKQNVGLPGDHSIFNLIWKHSLFEVPARSPASSADMGPVPKSSGVKVNETTLPMVSHTAAKDKLDKSLTTDQVGKLKAAVSNTLNDVNKTRKNAKKEGTETKETKKAQLERKKSTDQLDTTGFGDPKLDLDKEAGRIACQRLLKSLVTPATPAAARGRGRAPTRGRARGRGIRKAGLIMQNPYCIQENNHSKSMLGNLYWFIGGGLSSLQFCFHHRDPWDCGESLHRCCFRCFCCKQEDQCQEAKGPKAFQSCLTARCSLFFHTFTRGTQIHSVR